MRTNQVRLVAVAASLLVSMIAVPFGAQAAIPSCTHEWDADSHGSWEVAENWNPDVVPDEGDTACINLGYTVTIANGGAVSNLTSVGFVILSGGLFTISGEAVVRGFTQTGGTLAGAGSLTVSTNMQWTGGTQRGPGSTVVTDGGVISGSETKTLASRALEVGAAAFVEWKDGGTIAMTDTGSGPSLLNVSGYLNSPDGDRTLSGADAGSVTVGSGGTLAVAAWSGGTMTIEVPMSNAGSLIVAGGTLHLAGSSASSSGTVDVQHGQTLEVDAGLQLTDGDLLGNGTVVGDIEATGGRIRPGDRWLAGTRTPSVGWFTVTGNYTQGASAGVTINLQYKANGFDRLIVSGTVSLAGSVEVDTDADAFDGTAGSTYRWLTAATVTGSPTVTDLDAGDGWNYSGTAGATFHDLVLDSRPPMRSDAFVTLAHGATDLVVGDVFTVIPTIGSNGPDGAENLKVAVAVPAQLRVTGYPDWCTLNGSSLDCVWGDQGANSGGGAGAWSFVAVRSGTPTFLATLTSDTADPSSSNNSVSVNMSISAAESVTRLAGMARIATAIEVSRASHPNGANFVVLARADDFPDALSGAPFAELIDAPLLLTHRSGAVDSTVMTEIRRLLGEDGIVFILGGEAAISAAAEAQLGLEYEVTRIAGTNRYETAVEIAKMMPAGPIFLATGRNFPDALGAGPAAASVDGIVLLTADDVMPTATQELIDSRPGTTIYAVGGPAAAAAPSQATSFVGSNRYETALLLAQRFFPSPAFVGIATGRNFPDALSGAAHIAARRGPILLVAPDAVPTGVRSYLQAKRTGIARGWVYGGEAAVTEPTLEEIRALLG